jgi:Flp pilus assembly protein TadB
MTTLAAGLLGAGVGLGLYLVLAAARGVKVVPRPRPGAGSRRGPHRAITTRIWVTVGVAVVAWLATGWPAAAVVVGLAALAVPRLFGAGKRREMIDKTEAVAAWAEMLRDAMSAADGVEEAIEATVPIAPPPIRAQVAMLDAARRSMPLTDALAEFGEQVDHPSADLLVAALVIAARGEGADFAEVLSRLAGITRDEVRMRLRIEASRARLRTSARVIVTILGLVVVVLPILSSDYLAPYRSASGQLVLVVVASLFAGGVVLMERMAAIDLPERFVPRRQVHP